MTPSTSTRLLDLLSERNDQVRRLSEQSWNEQSDIHISNSEWYILATLHQSKTTIAEVTRSVHVSRQAIHKLIKNLESKALVLVTDHPHNRKDKCIELTALGYTCYEQNEALKAQLEQRIREGIGQDAFEQLKIILRMDWKL
ncbi:MarR family transcriptional regulator [Exiguobacterium marinum]|uniref:MarR family transcriptional regulator n=1 Tax=Exiguobacterium marinum TaxID=273528 RepID=A0ABY7WZR4_9BACL|nr:MarR family transcriptional regulator [Exiguobacterium marinum]WDH75988.1 MarR family transcriptional regulator [Exiguobacterium marinum]